MGSGWLWVIVPVLVLAVVVGLATGHVLAWFIGGVVGSILLVAVIYTVGSRR